MDILQTFELIGVLTLFLGAVAVIISLNTKSTKELIAELRKDNADQSSKIAKLERDGEENRTKSVRHGSELSAARSRVDQLQASLDVVLEQLGEVHDRLNRESAENHLKTEIITEQESQIAAHEQKIVALRIQRDEARLALTLVSNRDRETPEAKPDPATADKAAQEGTESKQSQES